MEYVPKPDDSSCPYPRTPGENRIYSQKRKAWFTTDTKTNKFRRWLSTPSDQVEQNNIVLPATKIVSEDPINELRSLVDELKSVVKDLTTVLNQSTCDK